MNRVILNLGNFKLDEIQLEKGTLTIGRAPDNDIRLEDPATSSRHAKLVTIFTSSFIEDLNSTNGTIVNGRKIIRHTLHHGDVISIGNLQLLFKSEDGASADKDKHTVTMDKSKLDSMIAKSSSQAGVTINKGKNTINESLTTAPEPNKDVTPLSIPTLDQTLPLSELRKNSTETIVTNLDVKSKSTPTASLIKTKSEPVEEKQSNDNDNSGYEDTIITLESDVDLPFEEPFDEKAMQAELLGEMDDSNVKVLTKVAVVVSIMTLIILAIYLIF